MEPEFGGRPVEKGTPVLVFLGGFPDDKGVWSLFAPRFAETHALVLLCLPEYDRPNLSRFWGYSVQEIEALLASVIDSLPLRRSP